MANFNQAVEEVLKHEGGFNYCDPSDSGGCTKYGIAHRTYSNWLGREATYNDIKNMPKGNAVRIYKDQYWNPIQGDRIKSQAVALVIFDQGVNRGPASSVKQAQRVLGIYPSGKLDNATLERLNNFDSEEFVEKFLEESRNAYEKIAENKYKNWYGFGLNSDGKKWLNIWLNRVDSLEKESERIFSMGSNPNLARNLTIGVIALGSLAVLAMMYQPKGARA